MPCGDACHAEVDGLPLAEVCEHCDPYVCTTCGELDHPTHPCACWIDLTTMPLADVKAVFAKDGGFNVESDGTLTRADRERDG